MKQSKIKKKADKIRKELKLHRKKAKRDEEEIIDRWRDIMDECKHPDLRGDKEGYCPDCGYQFG